MKQNFLRQLIQIKGITRKQILESTDIEPEMLSHYLYRNRKLEIMPMKFFVQLADLLGLGTTQLYYLEMNFYGNENFVLEDYLKNQLVTRDYLEKE